MEQAPSSAPGDSSARQGPVAPPDATPADALPAVEVVPAVPTRPAVVQGTAADRPPSSLIQVLRALAGIGALTVAWGGIVVMVLLVATGERVLARETLGILRAASVVGGVLALLWLLLAVGACVLAGAYCLMLALTRRRW